MSGLHGQRDLVIIQEVLGMKGIGAIITVGMGQIG